MGADGAALARSRLWDLSQTLTEPECIRNTVLAEAPPLRQERLVTGHAEGPTASPIVPA